jgi:hypothetical protein
MWRWGGREGGREGGKKEGREAFEKRDLVVGSLSHLLLFGLSPPPPCSPSRPPALPPFLPPSLPPFPAGCAHDRGVWQLCLRRPRPLCEHRGLQRRGTRTLLCGEHSLPPSQPSNVLPLRPRLPPFPPPFPSLLRFGTPGRRCGERTGTSSSLRRTTRAALPTRPLSSRLPRRIRGGGREGGREGRKEVWWRGLGFRSEDVIG